MSNPVHKPAANPFATYAFQDNEENEDEQEEDEEEEEMEWSDEEDLHDYDEESEDDFDEEYGDDDDDFDDDYDFDTEEGDHEYVDGENSHYRNNYEAGPGYFYPEQPYVGPPTVPKPSPEAESSKLSYYVLSPICDIAMIYIKFAILTIFIYACALLYTVYYGDLSSITDMDEDDADTCPAN